MSKDFSLLALHLCLKVLFDYMYRKIWFIGLLATNLPLMVTIDNVYRETA